MKKEIGFKEFVALMAMMIALTALSIDAMLPALTNIGTDLGVTAPNDNQLIISILFLGLAIGQLFYGPLSDNIGRKPAVYFGLLIFGIGCIISMFSKDLTTMLVGRCLQGIGLSGPRVVTIAIIRDLYKGERMAQVMSFVLAVFIAVPAIAPAVGQGVLYIADWRMIFVVLLSLGTIAFIWFYLRQEETLTKENRMKFSFANLRKKLKEIITIRSTIAYTLAAGFISSAFVGFLNSSQQVFQIQFGLGERFPIYFAAIALSLGLASFVNGKLVIRYGMQKMVRSAALSIVVISIIFYGLINTMIVTPSLTFFMLYLLSTVFFVGILFGNLNSMAMEPLGHMAGIGAAIVGSVSTFISVPFGTYIGMQYNGSVEPMVMGFLVFGSLTALSIFFAKGRKVTTQS
ncbi:MAG: multidrug effflux MFS transporter [Flavobacteriales bacterium]|jgi:DHA1 family bicyclomycin/chloramphenicol resistance-like MFS transporter|tara:strand:+ start:1494 stop:2699 length:1206 start_codon:yes stop_codon:yes gene_type:complete